MGKQSAEKYLDELLNSVNREEKHNELMEANKDFVMELQTAMSAGVGNDFAEIEASHASMEIPYNYRMSPKAEAEFLMEFEKELEDGDYEDFLASFEEEESQPEVEIEVEDVEVRSYSEKVSEEQALMSILGDSFEDVMGATEVEAPMSVEELLGEPEPEHHAPITEVEGEPTEVPLDALDGLDLDALFGTPGENADFGAASNVSPADPEVVDLGQLGDEDLLNLLAGADDLSDIGSMLSQSDNALPLEAEDPFAAFAADEMSATEATVSGAVAQEIPETKKTAKSSKNAKGGFLGKLMSLLFGPDEDEAGTKGNKVDLAESALPSVEELSEENSQILAAFADAEKSTVDSKKDSKNKGKKDKKDKKAKEPKAKKEPKPKKPKMEKPKKVKEVDNTPPLPKGPVVMVFVLAISLVVLMYMGPSMIGYHSSISEAKKLLSMGQYTEAAKQISGLEIKKEDIQLHGKIATLAAVDSEISMYRVFKENERWGEALDTLLCAAGRVVLNEGNAVTFECAGELETLKNWIEGELQEQFDIKYKKAVQIYQLGERDRDAYTRELEALKESLGIE